MRNVSHTAKMLISSGANEGIRTPDLLITNQLRYRLRHISSCNALIIHHETEKCKSEFHKKADAAFSCRVCACIGVN